MATCWANLADWLTFRGLRERRQSVRERPPIPTVPVDQFLRRIDNRLQEHATLPGVFPPHAVVMSVTADHVSWDHLDPHLERAERHRHLAGALPDLLYLPGPARHLVRGLAKIVCLLVRGIANRQTECNAALLAHARGLAARLQACETQVLVQEDALRQMQARLQRLESSRETIRRAA